MRRIDEKSIAEGLVCPRQVFVLSGPSGVGKNTIADTLCRQGRAVRAVTATTRPAKPGEVNGRDYIFVGQEEFRRWVEEGRMLEYTSYVGHCYGTPFASVNQAGVSGLPVMLTIDVDGGLQVKRRWPEVSLIFIKPPSEEELRRRLWNRGRDDAASIQERLDRAQQEYSYAGRYDFCVVNDRLDRAVEEVAQIMSRRCRPAGSDC